MCLRGLLTYQPLACFSFLIDDAGPEELDGTYVDILTEMGGPVAMMAYSLGPSIELGNGSVKRSVSVE